MKKRELPKRTSSMLPFFALAAIATFFLLLQECHANDVSGAETVRSLHDQIVAKLAERTSHSAGGKVFCQYRLLGTKWFPKNHALEAYVWQFSQEYEKVGNELKQGTGSTGPVLVRIDTATSPPTVAAAEYPRDGGYYSQDIKTFFPSQVRHQKIFHDTQYHNSLVNAMEKETAKSANDFFGID